MSVKISVIVPVYNVANFLDKCLSSIVNQNSENYEIILVNDGSTDNSLDICNRYYKEYPDLIKLFSKGNGGLSDARNFGIKHASGKYVMFVDSDDYIKNDTINSLIRIIDINDSPDIIYFGYFWEKDEVFKKKYTYRSKVNRVYQNEEFLINELSLRNLPIPACFGIYKKELIENNMFYKGILHEDERWTPEILINAKTIYVTDEVFYHYVQRDGSITHKKDKFQNGLDLISTCYYLKDKYECILDKRVKKLFNNRLSMVYMRAVTVGCLDKDKSLKIDRIFPLKNTFFLKDRLKAVLFFINIRLYCKINKKWKKMG